MDKNRVINALRGELLIKAQRSFEIYKQDNKLNQKYLGGQNNIPELVTEEQVDLGKDEFFEYAEDLNENNFVDKVREYVAEQYDDDFMYGCIERKVNSDTIKELLADELVMKLINQEPYGYAPRRYWVDKVNQVHSLKELATYVETEECYEFVEKYASDWEDVMKENRE